MSSVMRDNFYVDDGLESVANSGGVIDLTKINKELCKEGFNLD